MVHKNLQRMKPKKQHLRKKKITFECSVNLLRKPCLFLECLLFFFFPQRPTWISTCALTPSSRKIRSEWSSQMLFHTRQPVVTARGENDLAAVPVPKCPGNVLTLAMLEDRNERDVPWQILSLQVLQASPTMTAHSLTPSSPTCTVTFTACAQCGSTAHTPETTDNVTS